MDRNRLTEYVERVFELYGLDKRDYFYSEFDDDEIELRSPFPENIPVESSLRRLSVYLGLSAEEIASMDKRAAMKYWRKYPFFSLYNQFISKLIWNARYKSEQPDMKQRLLAVLFDVELKPVKRYKWEQVRKRLMEQLKEMADFDPVYYQEGKELEIINIDTAEFFSFPKCGVMIRDYIRMVNRLQELFFKAVNQDLTTEEINEYNFLILKILTRHQFQAYSTSSPQEIQRSLENTQYIFRIHFSLVLLR